MRGLFTLFFCLFCLQVNASYSPYSKDISIPSLISAESNLTSELEGVSDTTSDNEVTYESLISRFSELYDLASLHYTEASTYESSSTSLDWKTLGVYSFDDFETTYSLPSSTKFVSINGRIAIANMPEGERNTWTSVSYLVKNSPLFGYWGSVIITASKVVYNTYPTGVVSISNGELSKRVDVSCSDSNYDCVDMPSITIKYLE